jgi:hypothetical protein
MPESADSDSKTQRPSTTKPATNGYVRRIRPFARFRPIDNPLPNFLIAGAAKCGTTAVANYLDQHPEIYFSPVKEPKFISSQFIHFPLQGKGDDFIESFTVKRFEDYKKLFKKARAVHRAIGEASVENLYYYEQSIPVIKRYLSEPRILIILRNPIDRAFSAYKQMLRDERESLPFEKAFAQEERRRADNWEFLWFYGSVGLYAAQVEAFLNSFARVQVMFFDDFLADPHDFCRSIFTFLNVNPDFKIALTQKRNVSGIPKNALYRTMLRASALKGRIYRMLTTLGVSDRSIQPILESIRNGALTDFRMPPETRVFLQNFYRKDIQRLGRLLDRDLTHWFDPPVRKTAADIDVAADKPYNVEQ